ncbi:MAG TPA: flagellar protein FlaF, partial [Methanosarcina sp.]|nr:flagellar protein FlaF [Methanosarcina sp.]
MGLDTIIVAFFVVGTILVVAGTLTMGVNNLVESSYNGYVSAHQTIMDRLQTRVEVQNIVFNVSTNHTSFTVANTGETKLYNFDHW